MLQYVGSTCISKSPHLKSSVHYMLSVTVAWLSCNGSAVMYTSCSTDDSVLSQTGDMPESPSPRMHTSMKLTPVSKSAILDSFVVVVSPHRGSQRSRRAISIHTVTVTQFHSISIPSGFRRHLVGILEIFVTRMSLKYALSAG